MTQVQFLDWAFLVDTNVAADIYLSVDKCGADKCDCSFCKNYIAKRPKLFDTQLISLFNDLWVDNTKEYEVCYLNRESNGFHLYTTWFDFAGQILDGPDFDSCNLTSNLSIAFAEKSKPADSFFNKVVKVVQMTFTLTIPWMIGTNEPP